MVRVPCSLALFSTLRCACTHSPCHVGSAKVLSWLQKCRFGFMAKQVLVMVFVLSSKAFRYASLL